MLFLRMKKAIVLLSGGLDSATILHYAKSKGFKPYCLIFDYGQRHRKEIVKAKRIAACARCRYRLMKIALPWQGSSLLDKRMRLPQRKEVDIKNLILEVVKRLDNKEVNIEEDIPSNIKLKADAELIGRVIYNLLDVNINLLRQQLPFHIHHYVYVHMLRELQLKMKNTWCQLAYLDH